MLSSEKLYSLDDESDDDGSDSGSAGTCAFPIRFEESIGHINDSVGHVDNSVCRVHGVGSDIFFPTGIKSIGDVVPLVVFVPICVASKGGQLIALFWCPKSRFSLQF